jgi:glycosyltransferase involved in cell wall biosynthesis
MISVCITTFNGEKYIKEQLDSILPQIGVDDEVVVSDDGSNDSTINIIESYHDKRIKIFHHDSTVVKTTFPLDKPTYNFENALRHANGDIIFLSDQDDVWLPGKVKAMLDALQHAHLAIHDCIVTDQQLNPILNSYFEHIHVHQGVIKNMIHSTYLGCCMAMRKEVVQKALPFPKTKVGHDLWLGLIADLKFKTTLVKQPYLLYRKHQSSITTSGFKSKYSLWFKINYRIEILKSVLKAL